MHGLSQIHLQSRGVVFRVKMAEYVLYNEIIKVIIVIIAAYFDAYVLYSQVHARTSLYVATHVQALTNYAGIILE